MDEALILGAHKELKFKHNICTNFNSMCVNGNIRRNPQKATASTASKPI